MDLVKAEYIWIDGYHPTQNLRSKTKKMFAVKKKTWSQYKLTSKSGGQAICLTSDKFDVKFCSRQGNALI